MVFGLSFYRHQNLRRRPHEHPAKNAGQSLAYFFNLEYNVNMLTALSERLRACPAAAARKRATGPGRRLHRAGRHGLPAAHPPCHLPGALFSRCGLGPQRKGAPVRRRRRLPGGGCGSRWCCPQADVVLTEACEPYGIPPANAGRALPRLQAGLFFTASRCWITSGPTARLQRRQTVFRRLPSRHHLWPAGLTEQLFTDIDKEGAHTGLDFLILYEHPVREYESDLLLKLELQRRGYTAEIRQLLDRKKLKYSPEKARVLVASCMYDNEAINSHMYNNGAAQQDRKPSLEQMLSDTQERATGSTWAATPKKCVQTCWGPPPPPLAAHGMQEKTARSPAQ